MNSLYWIARAAIGAAGVGGLGFTVWGASKTATAQAPTSTPNSRYPLDTRVSSVATTALSPEQRMRWLPPAQETAYQAFMASDVQIKGDDEFQKTIRVYIRELCTREIGRELLRETQKTNRKLVIEPSANGSSCQSGPDGSVKIDLKQSLQRKTIDFRRVHEYSVIHPPFLTLAHEMIHHLHKKADGTIPVIMFKRSRAPLMTTLEEQLTITGTRPRGRKKGPLDHLNEHAICDAFGIPKRYNHLQVREEDGSLEKHPKDFLLYFAAAYNKMNAMRKLLAKNTDVDDSAKAAFMKQELKGFTNHTREDRQKAFESIMRETDTPTPLLIAIKQGHLEAVQLLVERGADLLRTDERGVPTLAHALKVDDAIFDFFLPEFFKVLLPSPHPKMISDFLNAPAILQKRLTNSNLSRMACMHLLDKAQREGDSWGAEFYSSRVKHFEKKISDSESMLRKMRDYADEHEITESRVVLSL